MMSKILIVDDAKLMRNMIKNMITQKEGHKFIEASNGEDAVMVYKAIKPDLVTMDITMDIKNGVDATKEILKHDPEAKIIIITALGQEGFLKDCVKLGVKDFIVNPFSKERVTSAINSILEF